MPEPRCLHIGPANIVAIVTGKNAGQQYIECCRCGAKTTLHKYATNQQPREWIDPKKKNDA